MSPTILLALLTPFPSATEPPITDVAFAPDGNTLVAISQTGLLVLRWPDLKHDRRIRAAASNLHSVTFSPNGAFVAVGGGNPAEDGSVEIFSWPAGKSIVTFEGHADCVRSVVWRDNAGLFSASIDRKIKLWNLDRSELVTTYGGHSRSVAAIYLLPDGRTLVSSGDDQSVRVWDVESGELVHSQAQHTKPVHALALRTGADGLPMIASAAGDRTIRFWQPTIGRMVRYVRFEAEPLDIAWLGDGSRIVASCVDGRVRVVDAEEVRVIQTHPAIAGWAYAVAVHPSYASMVVGGSAGEIRRINVGLVEEVLR